MIHYYIQFIIGVSKNLNKRVIGFNSVVFKAMHFKQNILFKNKITAVGKIKDKEQDNQSDSTAQEGKKKFKEKGEKIIIIKGKGYNLY